MKRWIAILLLAGLCVTAWLAIGPTKSTQPQPRPLSFLLTCDVRGRLVPCGCFSGQLGGLTRIASIFGKGVSPDSVKLDAGDAIAGAADYEQIQYGYLQKAFATMGYEALNAGHREARLSLEELRRIKSSAPVPIVSANLLDKSSGAPVFEPWRIITKGDWRIAIIGVLDPRGIEETLGAGLRVEEMDVALEKALPKLKDQADFCVLLAFTDEANLGKLAKQFYELDIILGGKVSQPSQRLVKENHSLILATTNESRAIGLLQTTLVAKHHLEPIKGEVHLVSDHNPQDEQISALEKDYRDEIRKTKLSVDDLSLLREDMVPGVKASASYVGSQSCATCHASAANTWSHSKHAIAFSALIKAGADADPNCIGCHTVGFGTLSGYLREFGDKKLTNVGCESCHGPGSQHVNQRTAGGTVTAHFRPVGESDCRKCHHGEFSRPFVWAQLWPKIAHGKQSAISQ